MDKKDIKIVIGANFGDEGKGLMTDYFVNQVDFNKKALVICSNGGAQRGHTVLLLKECRQKKDIKKSSRDIFFIILVLELLREQILICQQILL